MVSTPHSACRASGCFGGPKVVVAVMRLLVGVVNSACEGRSTRELLHRDPAAVPVS
jgi:hypothetical protein